MRTTNKEVTQKIQAHILDYYEDREGVEGLKKDIEAAKYGNMGDYRALRELVNGGSFLIYHHEVQDFLNSLGINEEKKEYEDAKSWELYSHLIAREGLKLIAED